jgi:hypothetical protein
LGKQLGDAKQDGEHTEGYSCDFKAFVQNPLEFHLFQLPPVFCPFWCRSLLKLLSNDKVCEALPENNQARPLHRQSQNYTPN